MFVVSRETGFGAAEIVETAEIVTEETIEFSKGASEGLGGFAEVSLGLIGDLGALRTLDEGGTIGKSSESEEVGMSSPRTIGSFGKG